MTAGARIALAGAAVFLGAGTAAATMEPSAVLQPYLILGASGSPEVGEPVRVEPGVWSGSPSGFRFTWQRCAAGTLDCGTLAGATEREYLPMAEDVGATLRVVVRPAGTTGGADAVTATSPAVSGPRQPSVSATGVVPAGSAGDGRDPGAAAAGGGGPIGVPRRLALRFGAVHPISGALVDATGTGTADEELTLRDPAGRPVAVARTGAGGRFTVAGRFTRPGPWVLAGRGWTSGLRIDLRPVVHLRSATRAIRPPGVVAVRGRILPGVAGKLVQLQYLDPGRGWRLWKQVPTERGGRFALRRLLQPNPRAPRYLLRMRVVVPADVGWPFSPATSRVIPMRVG